MDKQNSFKVILPCNLHTARLSYALNEPGYISKKQDNGIGKSKLKGNKTDPPLIIFYCADAILYSAQINFYFMPQSARSI